MAVPSSRWWAVRAERHAPAPLPGSLFAAGGVLALVACLLWLAYRPATSFRYDVGHQPAPLLGMYEDEQNATIDYAYTNGYALALVPQISANPQMLELTLGGPFLSDTITTTLVTPQHRFELGAVGPLRTYHVLVPTDSQGSLRVGIASSVMREPDAQRQVGVLIDSLAVVSPGRNQLPVFVLLCGLLLAGAGLWLGRQAPRLWQRGLLALAVAAGLLGLVAARGRLELPPFWWLLGATGLVLGSVALLQSRVLQHARPWVAVTLLVGIWRVALWWVAAFGLWFSGLFVVVGQAITREGQFYPRTGLAWNALVGGWAQWDSQHYTSIATIGYRFLGERWPTIAFFPLYPLLIRPLEVVLGNADLAGFIVSNLAFLAALLVLYDLVRRDFGRQVALASVACTLLLPTSVFFGAVYSESLALLLMLAAVWALRQQRWWLAGTCGLLLTLTRLPGVMIAPLIVLAYLQHIGWRWRNIRWPVLAAALPPLGLLAFMAYQWATFGTPLAFMQAQDAWNNQLSPPWTLPTNLVLGILESPDWPIFLYHTLFYLATLVLLAVAFRRLPLLYSMASLLLVLPSLLASWPWSVGRHVLVSFACVIVLAQLAQRRRVAVALACVMLPLLVLTALLFVNGWWIA